jgi:hypothetical protein
LPEVLDLSFPRFPQIIERLYLRAKSPGRRRLKDRVRLLLTYHKDFGVWEDDREFLCGFAAWRDRYRIRLPDTDNQTAPHQLSHEISNRYPGSAPKEISLLKIAPVLFDLIGGRVELDSVVDVLATLLHAKDRPLSSIDEDPNRVRNRKSSQWRRTMTRSLMPRDFFTTSGRS